MKTIQFTNEELEQIRMYLSFLPHRVTKAKKDLKNIESLIEKLK
tara:strand:+ start:369 stop:500 length:132 start_codon:yes stop_codon:yes gene_type:complete